MSKANKRLDNIIFNSQWAIDEVWAYEQWNNYVQQLDLLESGKVQFSELGFSKKREEQKPKVLFKSEEGFQEMSFSSGADIPSGSIAKLSLTGVMRVEDGLSSRGVKSLCNDIQECSQHESISGIIIEASTGGGEALAGQMLKNAIQDSSVPVLIYAHFLASAGIKGTLTANEIWISGNSTFMGSIGTYLTLNKSFLQWYKENHEEIYSPLTPGKNEALREYQKTGNKDLFQNIVTDLTRSFQNEVSENRNLKGNVAETLSGGIFQGKDNIERGLADKVGTFNEALSRISELINSNKTNSNMKFSLKSWANGFFSKEFESDEQAQEYLSKLEIETFDNLITEKVNDAVNGLSEKVTGNETAVSELKTTVETSNIETSKTLEAYKVRFEKLEEENKSLVQENEKLNKQLAENLGGDPNKGINTGRISREELDKQIQNKAIGPVVNIPAKGKK